MVVSSQHHAWRRTSTDIMTLSEQLAGNSRTVCAQARGQQGECSAPELSQAMPPVWSQPLRAHHYTSRIRSLDAGLKTSKL